MESPPKHARMDMATIFCSAATGVLLTMVGKTPNEAMVGQDESTEQDKPSRYMDALTDVVCGPARIAQRARMIEFDTYAGKTELCDEDIKASHKKIHTLRKLLTELQHLSGHEATVEAPVNTMVQMMAAVHMRRENNGMYGNNCRWTPYNMEENSVDRESRSCYHDQWRYALEP